MSERGQPAVLAACEAKALLRFRTAHHRLEDLLAAHHDPHRTAQLHRGYGGSDRLLAHAEFRAETAADIAGEDTNLVFFQIQRVGQFGYIVVQHLQRCVNGQLAIRPFGDGRMWLHRGAGVPFRLDRDVDAVLGIRHRAGEIALIDRLVLLLFGIDLGGVQRSAPVRSVFYRKMLRRIAGLLERFGNDQRNRLAPVTDRARLLLRGLVGGPLRCAGGQPLVVDNGDDARHVHHAGCIDAGHFTARNRRGDENTFGAVVDRVFGGIGRGSGYLRQSFDPGNRLADNPLLHGVEAICSIGFVLLQMRGHSSVSVASASTALSVLLVSGILKSFSP